MVPVQRLAAGGVAELLRHQPLSPGKVAFAWRVSVGPQIGRVTEVTLAATGRLHVRATDPRWRREIERSRPLILSRLENLLGRDVVRGISVS